MEEATVVKQWEHRGLTCVVVRHGMGHHCGYVRLTEQHPLFGVSEKTRQIDALDVHGGITFAGDDVPWPGGGWWIGFHCIHGGDAWLNPNLDPTELTESELEQWNLLKRLASSGIMRDKHYWTAEEVEVEVDHLADQL